LKKYQLLLVEQMPSQRRGSAAVGALSVLAGQLLPIAV